MAFQPVPDTAEAVIVGTQNGVILTMTHYAKYTGVYTEQALQDLADAYDTWMGTELLPFLSDNYAYDVTNVRGLSNINDLTKFALANAGVGGIVAEGMPNNATFAVKRLSGFTGRSARGRVYVAGIPANALSSNENFLGAVKADELVEAHQNISDYLVGTGWSEVIVSRYSGGVKRAFGETFPVLLWSKTDDRMDSRRDRLP